MEILKIVLFFMAAINTIVNFGRNIHKLISKIKNFRWVAFDEYVSPQKGFDADWGFANINLLID